MSSAVPVRCCGGTPDGCGGLSLLRGYGRDRHLKFHEYERKRPTGNVQALLDHIETSGAGTAGFALGDPLDSDLM